MMTTDDNYDYTELCQIALKTNSGIACQRYRCFPSGSEPHRTRTCNQGLNLPLRISSARYCGGGLDYIFAVSGALLIVSEDSLKL
jgi:hypothetical protein